LFYTQLSLSVQALGRLSIDKLDRAGSRWLSLQSSTQPVVPGFFVLFFFAHDNIPLVRTYGIRTLYFHEHSYQLTSELV